jgi:hypothetical protein
MPDFLPSLGLVRGLLLDDTYPAIASLVPTDDFPRHKSRGTVNLPPRNKLANPTRTAAMPPMTSHIALLVGEPVKNRETPELNDSEAFTPQAISMIPTITNAREIPLFMFPFLTHVYSGFLPLMIRSKIRIMAMTRRI